MSTTPSAENTYKAPTLANAVFALGFRPFFLAAGIYAVLMMALWLMMLAGHLDPGKFTPLAWHGHEMLFGFTIAVIAGFLLTAAQNWTGIAMPSGRPLILLFVLWIAGRLAFLIPNLPAPLVALLDLSFLPVLAVALALPVLRTRQLHNYPFPFLVLALAAANAVVHLNALGLLNTRPLLGLHLAAYLVVMMMVLMGGRVIPSFTENKLRSNARRWKVIEVSAPILALVTLITALIAPIGPITAMLAAITAAIHLIRLAGWYTSKLWAVPLLWILHLGYAWIAIGFALLALYAAGMPTAGGSALHAFTAGGIGVLTLGMMARVSLGHTGRLLEPPRVMTLAFIAINFAALVRVVVPLLFPVLHPLAMTIAGLAWIVAFGLYAIIYAPMLLRPRVDGRPG